MAYCYIHTSTFKNHFDPSKYFSKEAVIRVLWTFKNIAYFREISIKLIVIIQFNFFSEITE